VAEPPSLTEINKTFAEFDGSGSGLMTSRQIYAACQAITNLGFSDSELQNYVKEGLEVAGDGSGRIKMAEFAAYIAFEAKKKFKKQNESKPKETKKKDQDYQNPFSDFVPTQTQKMNITITPDPLQSKEQQLSPKVDMKGSYSPTEAKETDLPQWFGHSVKTITTHPNEVTADDPFSIFDDDSKTNNGLKIKSNHTSIATQDILFADDDTTTSNGNTSATQSENNGVDKTGNLSPRRAKKQTLKKTQSGQGLLPAPRSKGDKVKKKKKTNKHSAVHSGPLSFDTNIFADDVTLNVKTKKTARDQLKFTKAHSEMVPESTHKLKAKENKTNKTNEGNKKRRNKIDAIVEMKRGAAMLKYGRRGFPHFRRFQISHDLTKLLWYSRKKSLNETHVSIKEMKDILDGQQTEVFKQCTQKTLEKASFSIIYGPKLKSLDVVAKSAEEAQLWIKGLKGLIKANQQGKLHKVVQILVDVDFKDISKTKYRHCSDDERRKYEVQHKNRPELVHTIATTLQQSRKIFTSLVKISATNNVQNSNEFVNIQTLTSEIEERLEEIEYGLTNKTADLTDLKRDVWVLKVDVTVLEEKVKVLSKIKTAIPI